MLKSIRLIKTKCYTLACAGPFQMKQNQQNDMCTQRTQIRLGICPDLISFHSLHVEILVP